MAGSVLPPRRYFIEAQQDGTILKPAELKGSFRALIGDSVRIYLPAGADLAQENVSLRITSGDGRDSSIPFTRNALGGGFLDWVPSVSGSSRLCVTCEKFGTHEQMCGPVSTVVVGPRLELPDGTPIPHEGLSICTAVSVKLGQLDTWADRLDVLRRQKFNAIHFTPFQQPGESRSSYSIANHDAIAESISKGVIADPTDWTELSNVIETLRKDRGMLSFSDVVLNHVANNSLWLKDHVDVGYNEVTCPWLKGPIELDNAIKAFNAKLVNGEYQANYKASRHVNNEGDLNAVVRAFQRECLDKFSLREWFKLDTSAAGYTNQESSAAKLHGSEAIALLYEEALKLVGTTRDGLVLSPDVLNRGASDKISLQKRLLEVQQRLWGRAEQCRDSIVNAFQGTVRYERLESKRGAIDSSPWNSVVARYFSPVEQSDGRTLHYANNGWVMGWDALQDFTAPGTLVYFDRSLVAWSDCVKLRYGQTPADSPFLWEHMARYCERTAEIFDGIRLDNCHSTPLPVGQYMLSRARKMRPNLFVFAELFTGSAVADEKFERELGLNALVREAMQTGSPGDLAWHTFKYGGSRAGSVPMTGIPVNWDTEDREALPQKTVLNLFYDCTHDNPTLFEKGRRNDALANATFVCASACAVGSTMGYEVCSERNPEVWDNGKVYDSAPRLPPEPEKLGDSNKENEEAEVDGHSGGDGGIRVIWKGDASTVSLWGNFDSWKAGKPMLFNQKHNVWECFLNTASHEVFIVKFVINGNHWTTSDLYPILKDERGNSNNQVSRDLTRLAIEKLEAPRLEPGKIDFSGSPGIIEARRILNNLHWRMAMEGYDEVSAQWPCSDLSVISRHSQQQQKSVHFIIRSYWWKAPDFPEKREVIVNGRVTTEFLSAGVNCTVRGSCKDASCLFVPQPPNMHYDPKRDLTTLSFGSFPSGSVYVIETAVKRGDNINSGPALHEALAELDLDDLNKLIWSCEQEERDRSKGSRGVYQFGGSPQNMVYAGIAGVLPVIASAREACRNSPATKPVSPWDNVEDGDWLLDYHLARVNELLATKEKFKAWLSQQVSNIKASPHKLHRQQACDRLFTSLFTSCVSRCIALMPSVKETCEPLMERLALATTQVVGHVPSATITGTPNEVSLSAGLPFFSTEYMREWGRDTFLSLPGCLIATGRRQQAKNEILAYARVQRHGQIPNLLDSSNNPRYNARDAVFYWLQSIKDYCKAFPEHAVDLLRSPVESKYPLSLGYDMPKIIANLEDVVQAILTAHWTGIHFREWNAGQKIDEQMQDEGFNVDIYTDKQTGFPMGGNRFNCGTWMDKMGSSAKAGNKGIPASPRDGAPVELTLALLSVLDWLVEELIPNHQFHEDGTWQVAEDSGIISYREWRDKILANFDKEYFITENIGREGVQHTYRDTWGSRNGIEDLYLRCNYAVGLSFSGVLLPNKDHVSEALEVQYRRLVCEPDQVGIKTLDPANPCFRANYDNSNDGMDKAVAHGWNYHMGPEWVWPLGNWLQARFLVSDRSPESIFGVTSKLNNIRNWIGMAPWYSLPEVMDSNGRACMHGCQAQAWSLGTVLWSLHIICKDTETRRTVATPVADHETLTMPTEEAPSEQVLVDKTSDTANEHVRILPAATVPSDPQSVGDQIPEVVIREAPCTVCILAEPATDEEIAMLTPMEWVPEEPQQGNAPLCLKAAILPGEEENASQWSPQSLSVSPSLQCRDSTHDGAPTHGGSP